MERKIVVHKTKHKDFVYGYPYQAEVTHSKLRIRDPAFKGNTYTVYDASKFYIHDEYDKEKNKDNTDKDIVYNRCITMDYLTRHKDFVILRGLFFMSGELSVQDDSKCYYIYEPKNRDIENNGHFLEYDYDGKYFESQSEAVAYIKRTIDDADIEADSSITNLYDLDTFGGPFVYMMNANDIIYSVKDELEGMLGEMF
jgi:hypothetical protein